MVLRPPGGGSGARSSRGADGADAAEPDPLVDPSYVVVLGAENQQRTPFSLACWASLL